MCENMLKQYCILFSTKTLNLPLQDGSDGPKWRPHDSPYVCEIKSPKKETKFHGMKTFIVYQITPTVSIHVGAFLGV